MVERSSSPSGGDDGGHVPAVRQVELHQNRDVVSIEHVSLVELELARALGTGAASAGM
jgi:hypothetical protein